MRCRWEPSTPTRHQLVPARGWPVVLGALGDIGHVGFGINPAELAGLDDAEHDRGPLCRGEAAREKPIAPADRKSTNRPLRDQVVGLELAIVEEAVERAPSPGAIGEGLRDIGMARQTVALAHELSSQRPDQWSGPASSCGQSLGGWEPPYLFLDPVDRLDTGHRRRAEFGRLAVVNVEYLATQMGQAGSFSNGAALVDLVIAAETVGLERAGKSGELGHDALASASHGGAIPGDRRLLRTRVAVVGDVNPERAFVRLAGAGRQDRKPRVVGVNLGAGTADLADAIVDRIEQGGGVAGAARKGGSLDIPVGRSKSPGCGHLKLPHPMITGSATEQR